MDREISQPDNKRSDLKIIHLILTAVITTLIVGGGFYLWADQQQSKLNEKISELQKEQAKEVETDDQTDVGRFSTEYYEYELQTSFGEEYDQKLIRTNRETGEETVVIDSVKEALPELKEGTNLVLYIFATPENSDLIIFRSIRSSTSNISGTNYPGGVLYSFNTENNKFTRMKIGDIYNNYIGHSFSGYEISPDQTRFIWIPEKDQRGTTRIMYLFDLIDDSFSLVLYLSSTETFSKGVFEDMFPLSHFDIEWINNEKIRYAVFDISEREEGFNPETGAFIENDLIEYREIDL